jgi:hypothetical protein
MEGVTPSTAPMDELLDERLQVHERSRSGLPPAGGATPYRSGCVEVVWVASIGASLGDAWGRNPSWRVEEPRPTPRSSPPQIEHSRCSGATIRLDLVAAAVDDVTDADYVGEITPGGDGRGIQRGQQHVSEATARPSPRYWVDGAHCVRRARVGWTEAAG